jgi:hypothetical protein
VADPNLVPIDLELDTVVQAERPLARFRDVWTGPGGAVMQNPTASILERVGSSQSLCESLCSATRQTEE